MVPTTLERPAIERAAIERRRAAHRRTVARRYRAIGLLAAILATCAVWTQAGAADRTESGPLAAPGAGPTSLVDAKVWVVQPGDTIWAIARQLRPSGDMRNLVDELTAETHGQPLQVGQQLVLP